MDYYSQKSAWSDLSEDVLLKILGNMALKDIWACRHLSLAWSIVSATVLSLHVDVHVSVQNLLCKLRQIQWQKPRDTHCTVQVTPPLQLPQIYEILGQLIHQGIAIPNCKLVLQILFAPMRIHPNASTHIAVCVQHLKAQGIEVIVCLTLNHKKPMPHHQDLWMLAPMLNAFSHTSSASGQHYTTPGWTHLGPDDPRIVEQDYAVYYDDDNDMSFADFAGLRAKRESHFKLEHLQALLPALETLDTLCVSGDLGSGSRQLAGQGLQLLTAFTNLKKLELHCQSVRRAYRHCLQPLNTLSCLCDLTLMYYSPEHPSTFDSNFCQQLLHFQWLEGRYGEVGAQLDYCEALAAMTKMAALKTLLISVPQITRTEALLLSDLSDPWSIQLYIRDTVSGGVLEILSSGRARIQLLSLYSLPLFVLPSLKPMRDLTCLKIYKVDCHTAAQSKLALQPHLQHLVLRGIWLSKKQRAQLVRTCPALKVLTFSLKHQPLQLQKLVCDGRACKGRPAGNDGLRLLRRFAVDFTMNTFYSMILQRVVATACRLV